MVRFLVRLEIGDLGLGGRVEAAQRALDAAVLRDCAPFVPYRTGELLASGEALGGEVVYGAEHARRVYYGGGMNFRVDVHPLASAGWFEKAKAIHAGAWVAEAEAAL